jgi:stringent starvation protein B
MAEPSKSRRPYLIRAIYEWAVDNNYTPHVVVAADAPGVSVPLQFVKDGRITLNLSPMAVQSLHLDQEPMWFSARFGGRPFDVVVPSGSILAVFARENGEGVVFGEVEVTEPAAAPAPQSAERRGAHLQVASRIEEPEQKPEAAPRAPSSAPDEDPEPPKPRGRAHLRVVK